MHHAVAQLDNCLQIITPENIAFQYRLAGPFRRAVAYVLDFGIRLAVWGILALAAVWAMDGPGLREVGFGVAILLWFFFSWFYGGLFETFWNGQTPGKRLMGIRVLTIEGRPINGLQAILRNILRVVDEQPILLCQLGFWTAALTERFQRLGDLACGTLVIQEEALWMQSLTPMDSPEARQLAAQIPPGFHVSENLSRALAAYAQRRATFPRDRRSEIARHLSEPLREIFGLPTTTDPDLLLCALYHRTFLADFHDARFRPAGVAPRQLARAGATVR